MAKTPAGAAAQSEGEKAPPIIKTPPLKQNSKDDPSGFGNNSGPGFGKHP